jgi:hypothetical protein
VQKWSDLILFKSDWFSIFKNQNRNQKQKKKKIELKKGKGELLPAWADPEPSTEWPARSSPAHLPLPSLSR